MDIAIAPWAERDYIITEHRGYKREDVGNGWKEWADALEKRESVKKTTSVRVFVEISSAFRCLLDAQNKEYYTEIYGRYLRDEAQSEAAKATRAGRAIP